MVRIAFQGLSYCTGVLVANDLVLTAAHCVSAANAADLSIVFPLGQGDKIRSVAAFQKLRPDSLLYFPNFDIAWLRLSAPAPLPYEAVPVLGNTNNLAVDSAMKLIGTSSDTPCHPQDQICRLVQVAVKLKRSWSSTHMINLAVVDSTEQGSNSGTCPGDSGGPAFVERNGQSLLFGIVAGKDPVFTNGAGNACGSPTSVLTRIGEYQQWIESTSHRRLAIVDPASNMLSLEFLTGKSPASKVYSNWQDWFEKPLAMDSSWTTVHKLLEQIVLEFQLQITSDQIPMIFQDGGQEWVDKVTELKSLALGFPYQSIPIADLRPLAALKNLKDLTFLARSYQGLPVLETLSKLKSLSIIGRAMPHAEEGTLAWRELASSSVETLRLSQLSSLQMNEIDWTRFPSLQTLSIASPLGKVPSSWLREEGLPVLQTLQIQELSCDQTDWPKTPLPNLKSLILRSTLSLPQDELNCIAWDLLPGLTSLSIQGYQINRDQFAKNLPPLLASQIKAGRK